MRGVMQAQCCCAWQLRGAKPKLVDVGTAEEGLSGVCMCCAHQADGGGPSTVLTGIPSTWHVAVAAGSVSSFCSLQISTCVHFIGVRWVMMNSPSVLLLLTHMETHQSSIHCPSGQTGAGHAMLLPLNKQ